MMEDKEAVAVTKAKEENTEVSPTMDDMEEEAATMLRGLASRRLRSSSPGGQTLASLVARTGTRPGAT